MARRIARRKKSPAGEIRELLQMANIGSMEDIQSLFKETIAEFMENGLEAELDDELGYSKYDYKNKDTDNSRNGHSSKTLRTSFGDVEVSVPRDRKGEFEPQVLKKNQTSISQDIEEKILSMYAKGMTTGDIETIFRISTVFLYLPKFPTLRTRVKEELWLLILNYLKRKTIKKITDRIFLFPIRASLQLLSRIRPQELILCSRFPQKKKNALP